MAGPNDSEIEDLNRIGSQLSEHIKNTINILQTQDFENLDEFNSHCELVMDTMNDSDINELVRIKENQTNSRNTLLYLNILSDMEYIANHVTDLLMVCKKNYLKTHKKEEIPV